MALADLFNLALTSLEWAPTLWIGRPHWPINWRWGCPLIRYFECVFLFASILSQLIVCIERLKVHIMEESFEKLSIWADPPTYFERRDDYEAFVEKLEAFPYKWKVGERKEPKQIGFSCSGEPVMEREIIWDCVYAPNCRAKIRARKWTCCGRYIGGEMRTAIAKHHHPKARSPSGVDKYLDGV
uniref:Uncharacterized protein n=2 Tax=Meloidogyne incognita group TaxID=654580 RepID=A0A915LYA6_MELJA